MVQIKHIVRLVSVLLVAILLNSCKKEETDLPVNANIEWMRVLDENVSGSTEHDGLLGQNGKVITDGSNNIYVCYYSELPKQVVIIHYDAEGNQRWKKVIPDCTPMDMVLKPDGNVAVAVRELPGFDQIFVIFEISADGGAITQHPVIQTNQGGSGGVLSCNMIALPNNHLVMCGTYLASFLVGFPLEHTLYFLELDPSYNKLWNFITLFNVSLNGFDVFEQISLLPTSGGKYLVQFSAKANTSQLDSLSYKYCTVVFTPGATTFDTLFNYPTGYLIQSSGASSGYYNHYANGLMPDAGGGFVHHYSAPVSVVNNAPYTAETPNGFLKIATGGEIYDTVPFQLPPYYRIISSSVGVNGFLMTASKIGAIDVQGDFGASQTLFLTGNKNWQVTATFRLQEFYADFFPTSAPTSDGGFILMGKVQSFNGPVNKLVLIKWKDN
jgi:hypothetical protein